MTAHGFPDFLRGSSYHRNGMTENLSGFETGTFSKCGTPQNWKPAHDSLGFSSSFTVSLLLGIWLMIQLSTASIHVSVSSGQQKARIPGGPPELRWRSCCWNVWRGSNEDKTSAPFISGGPSSKFTRPSCSSHAAFRSATRRSQTHFKVSPAAVTSALRNVTGCLVPRHWLYPMCYHQHPPERNKKTRPHWGFPLVFWTSDWCI